MRNNCLICGQESAEIIDIQLYIIGSEGCPACLDCRITLAEVARGMKLVASKNRKMGYVAAKKVAEAKSSILQIGR